MTRAETRDAFAKSSRRHRRHMDVFCLTPRGIRVGYAAPKLLRTLPARERRRVRGRVVWASTSNRRYSVRGVRPGTRSALAARRLHLRRSVRIGGNRWYFALNGRATAVLRVRRGAVREVGIAASAVAKGRRGERKLLASFS